MSQNYINLNIPWLKLGALGVKIHSAMYYIWDKCDKMTYIYKNTLAKL